MLAQLSMQKPCLNYSKGVCLCVCQNVTLLCCVKTMQTRIVKSLPSAK